jgi:chromosome segregation ATPase
MTLEEALDKIASYKPRARATHEAVYAGYLTARQKKRLMGSTAPVTREEVRVEYGGNSTGTVSKYMLPIEIIEASKQEKAQAEPAQPQQDAQAKALPTGMQKVFDAIRTALDALPAATSETITALSAEQSARYQAVLDQQKLSAEATLREATDRIADLESASYGAGEESEEHQWQAEELRTALNAAAAERDSFASSLNTAKAEVQALKSEHDMDRAKIGYLEQNIVVIKDVLGGANRDLEKARRDAQLMSELRVQCTRAEEQPDANAREAEQLRSTITAMSKSHEQALTKLGADCEKKLFVAQRRTSELENKMMEALGPRANAKTSAYSPAE